MQNIMLLIFLQWILEYYDTWYKHDFFFYLIKVHPTMTSLHLLSFYD